MFQSNNNNTIKPFDLLSKLQNLNNIQPKSNKIYKQLQTNIAGYELAINESFLHLQKKLQIIQQQFKQLVFLQKQEEEFAIVKLDSFQSSIKNILNKYTEQSKSANNKINQMVQRLKEQHENEILTKSQQNKALLDQYSLLNQRLESIVTSIKKKQSQMLKKYDCLYKQIQEKMGILIERINISNQQIILNKNKFMGQIQEIENKIERQLQKLDNQKQQKRFLMHQSINKLIQDVTLYEDEQ